MTNQQEFEIENEPSQDERQADSSANTKTFTEEDVEAIVQKAVQKARDSAFADARKTFTKKKQDQPRQKQQREAEPEQVQSHDAFAIIDAVDDAAERFNLNSAQKRALRNRLKNSTNDLLEEIEEFAVIAGWSEGKTDAVETVASETEQNAGEQMKQKPLNISAPAKQETWERPSDPFKWTPDQLSQIRASKNNVREYQRHVRKAAENFMRGRSLIVKKDR